MHALFVVPAWRGGRVFQYFVYPFGDDSCSFLLVEQGQRGAGPDTGLVISQGAQQVGHQLFGHRPQSIPLHRHEHPLAVRLLCLGDPGGREQHISAPPQQIID